MANEERQNFKGWKDELQYLINKNNGTRVNGKVTSHKTQEDRAVFLFSFFNELRKNGYAVSPSNIGQRHIKFICAEYEKRGLSPASIQTYMMHLRVFCRWIRKDGMIGDLSEYFSDKKYYERTYEAVTDKSWSGNGIDIKTHFKALEENEPVVFLQMLMELAFGLRRKEVICFRPQMNVIGDTIHVVDGTKGGKTRVIPIENDFQREVLEKAKKFVGLTSATLSIKGKTLVQSMTYYSNVLTRYGITKKVLGVTGHGLRSEFAHNFMLSKGLVPSVKGGEAGQMNEEEEMRIRLETSARLGHNRPQITTAYSGQVPKPKKVDKVKVESPATKALDPVSDSFSPEGSENIVEIKTAIDAPIETPAVTASIKEPKVSESEAVLNEVVQAEESYKEAILDKLSSEYLLLFRLKMMN